MVESPEALSDIVISNVPSVVFIRTGVLQHEHSDEWSREQRTSTVFECRLEELADGIQ
jgi:hypothetical protein